MMLDRARITDVSPRDGLQNEPGVIDTGAKAELVRALSACGVDEVEVTSFVHPKWVPQLADAPALLEALAESKPAGVRYSVLVPNETGMRRALEANDAAGFRLIDKVAVFTAASETFSRKNTNASIAETIERFRPVVELARGSDLSVRGYISCVVACPYEGDIEPAAVAAVARRLLDLGVDELDLGDTIGVATPDSIADALLAAIDALGGRHTSDRGEPTLTLHLHDTFGRAAACVDAAVGLGVRSFDGSAGGLGGCPFAGRPGRPAPGNIATSLLVRTLASRGVTSGVDEARLAHASAIAERIVSAARTEAGLRDAEAGRRDAEAGQ